MKKCERVVEIGIHKVVRNIKNVMSVVYIMLNKKMMSPERKWDMTT